MRIRASAVAVLLLAALAALTACSHAPAQPNATDRTFLSRMIPHHERAIAAARIGVTRGDDPRVVAFAERIVREQTPELARMQDAARALGLDLTAGAMSADGRITDAQLASLRTARGHAFDLEFLQLHIASESGAARMASVEVRGGAQRTSVTLARSIASAPTTQIPELRSVLTALG